MSWGVSTFTPWCESAIWHFVYFVVVLSRWYHKIVRTTPKKSALNGIMMYCDFSVLSIFSSRGRDSLFSFTCLHAYHPQYTKIRGYHDKITDLIKIAGKPLLIPYQSHNYLPSQYLYCLKSHYNLNCPYITLSMLIWMVVACNLHSIFTNTIESYYPKYSTMRWVSQISQSQLTQ